VSVLASACVSGPRQGPQPPGVPGITATAGIAASSGGGTAPAGAASVEDYVAAIKGAAQRSDHESDAQVRVSLAAEATRNADACVALDPKAAGCQYGKAIATGLEARAHPAHAVGLLGSMLQSLGNAEGTDPNYDQAGPARVRALVLIRAPGWPVGPGDTDAGLAAARRAVALQPGYPPNVLALAEALAKTGDTRGAHESYARARDLAQAMPSAPERDEWLHDAEAGLNPR